MIQLNLKSRYNEHRIYYYITEKKEARKENKKRTLKILSALIKYTRETIDPFHNISKFTGQKSGLRQSLL